MLITGTVISILLIAALAWLANRVLSFEVCPICAGVFLTWVGLITAHFLGYQISLIVPALLMGGSVVGITYQLAPLEARSLTGLEKKFRDAPASQRLLWKALFIPAGFVAAYGILAERWAVSAGALAFLLPVTFLLLRRFLLRRFNLRSPHSGGLTLEGRETTEEIEKRMKDCC